MKGKIKRHQRFVLTVVIVICIGAILIGGTEYIESLRKSLKEQSVQNVLTVTQQQQQAFDNFISLDEERLHSFANYFARNDSHNTEDIQQKLKIFGDVDAFYSVINLDTGRCCNNISNEIYQLSDEELAVYRALSGHGVREPYIGLYVDSAVFGYYERFTFKDGVEGIIQKSYDRNKVSETFSLSFYNGQGFAYVVNRNGDILLRSEGRDSSYLYDNIFDLIAETHEEEFNIDEFTQALYDKESGSVAFTGEGGRFVYTYVSIENAEGWYLVSIVPEEVITQEADQMLLNSQVALGELLGILLLCAVVILFIWHTHKEIKNKEQEIDYQAQLFDIFSIYLAYNMDDIYMILDIANDHAEYISPNVERVLGIPAQDVMDNLSMLETISETGEKVEFASFLEMEPGSRAEFAATQWNNPKTGEQKWFQEKVYCTQVQGENRLIIYISDRTKEREIQDTLAQALQMAKAANKAKSAFLSSISHDIRTPMNAIIGFLALLRNEVDNREMVLEYVQRIDAASQHLLGLINDVLDMNKIESGSATLNLSDIELADIIEEINTIIRSQAKAKNQIFDISVSHIAYEHLRGDKLRINQILINLLSNAVKYTPEGGRIQMRVEELPQVVKDYSRIRFTISDNGLGMSEEYQKVMFAPFTREETRISHEIQGTGLGMAITKSLVDLMGGSIEVDSHLGKGSTFVVELELHIQEQENDPGFWTEHSIAKMIVADDKEEVCLNIVKAMKETGVLTEYSTDGQTAIQMMRRARETGHPYDLILLDWKMPNLNGLETARLIRKNYPDKIPILLLTAYDWSEIEKEAREIGINHFMPKPFFMSTFQDAIHQVMGSLRQDDGGEDTGINGKHILVVDDIEVNRIILVKILTTLGARCSIACNGQEALEMFEESEAGEYDIIFMDVEMPLMDGYTATRAIRSSSHPSAGTIPIIAMTANAFVDDVRDAINSGMDAHIAKPIQLDNLKATIRHVLESRNCTDI